ncbi:hypothetical protein FALBO_10833 [Fusarium albosuccineum]|uniref:Uncharacterized protein n=1 Tax=Fusarium albosuccineum TaxID=1237068 RepID=A0A8H4P9G2_9HYPO|nr:hypothetical protein FALBO_10833 [Fusarium albosuccineum]
MPGHIPAGAMPYSSSQPLNHQPRAPLPQGAPVPQHNTAPAGFPAGTMPHSQHPPAPPLYAVPADLRRRDAVQIVDIRSERLTEAEACERLSTYKVIRLEKAPTSHGVDDLGYPLKPTWERVFQIEPRDISQEDARRRVKQLIKDTKPVLEKKEAKNLHIQRQLECAQDDLENRDPDRRFCHKLVQFESKFRPVDDRHAKYSSRHRRDKYRKDKKFEKHSKRSRSPAMEREAIIAYFKRMPAPGESGLRMLEEEERERRRHQASTMSPGFAPVAHHSPVSHPVPAAPAPVRVAGPAMDPRLNGPPRMNVPQQPGKPLVPGKLNRPLPQTQPARQDESEDESEESEDDEEHGLPVRQGNNATLNPPIAIIGRGGPPPPPAPPVAVPGRPNVALPPAPRPGGMNPQFMPNAAVQPQRPTVPLARPGPPPPLGAIVQPNPVGGLPPPPPKAGQVMGPGNMNNIPPPPPKLAPGAIPPGPVVGRQPMPPANGQVKLPPPPKGVPAKLPATMESTNKRIIVTTTGDDKIRVYDGSDRSSRSSAVSDEWSDAESEGTRPSSVSSDSNPRRHGRGRSPNRERKDHRESVVVRGSRHAKRESEYVPEKHASRHASRQPARHSSPRRRRSDTRSPRREFYPSREEEEPEWASSRRRAISPRIIQRKRSSVRLVSAPEARREIFASDMDRVEHRLERARLEDDYREREVRRDNSRFEHLDEDVRQRRDLKARFRDRLEDDYAHANRDNFRWPNRDAREYMRRREDPNRMSARPSRPVSGQVIYRE